jgi:putative endonuclease
MNFVYILQNREGRHYIGQTENLEKRLESHNSGLVTSTKNKGPWEIIVFLQVESRSAAVKLESYLKSLKNSRKAIEYLVKLQKK